MISTVLAAFMAGLGLGSWASGHISRKYEARMAFHPLLLYAATELSIGISALVVPYELLLGGRLLHHTILSFAGRQFLAGVWTSITLIPWCACMGATFPFAMLAIKRESGGDKQHSFSYLYLANVLGAIVGTTLPLLLIELYGFHSTLYVGAILNLLLASSAAALAVTAEKSSGMVARVQTEPQASGERAASTLLWLLFGTGITSMGAEVVWTRLYTPSVGTLVYAFAAILALYLAATYIGSWFYRRRRNVGQAQG